MVPVPSHCVWLTIHLAPSFSSVLLYPQIRKRVLLGLNVPTPLFCRFSLACIFDAKDEVDEKAVEVELEILSNARSPWPMICSLPPSSI